MSAMKPAPILCALAALAAPILAGSRSGGTGAGAVTIPADTLLDGGGSAAAGTGANAVVITAGIGGIGGTVTAGTTSNQQGYIPQILPPPVPPLTGYALWASQNIPAGRDAAFSGDWNSDGIVNGIAYVFGNTRLNMTVRNRIPVPPVTPADVDIFLDKTLDLETWNLARVSWPGGATPTFANNGFTIQNGDVVDSNNPVKAFYRYRVVQR